MPEYWTLFNNCAEYLIEELLDGGGENNKNNFFPNFNISNMVDEPIEISEELFNHKKVKNIYGGYEKDLQFNKLEKKNGQSHSAFLESIRRKRDEDFNKNSND